MRWVAERCRASARGPDPARKLPFAHNSWCPHSLPNGRMRRIIPIKSRCASMSSLKELNFFQILGVISQSLPTLPEPHEGRADQRTSRGLSESLLLVQCFAVESVFKTSARRAWGSQLAGCPEYPWGMPRTWSLFRQRLQCLHVLRPAMLDSPGSRTCDYARGLKNAPSEFHSSRSSSGE